MHFKSLRTHIAALPVAVLLLCVGLTAYGRDARSDIRERAERAGGVYYAYPTDEISPDYGKNIPEGYEPFYVSHYGRHGSRYLISDGDYTRLMERLADAAEAGALTARGEQLRLQLDTIWQEARGRGGELTPLGRRQQRGIARRLGMAYPQIFAGDATVTAASTPVMRCAHSMFAFLEGIKELYPGLDIPRESSERNMVYLNYHSPESGPYASERGPWYQDYRRFKARNINPDRLIGTIFADNNYVDRWVDREGFYTDLYWLAVDLQNMETDINLLGLFTNDELYDIWQVYNFKFFARNSSYAPAHGLHTANARNLVRHIIDNADATIATGGHGATLRFGHDGNIIPLTALLRLEGCYSDTERPERLADDYADYSVSPMASNLQMVFFRNPALPDAGDVLVRVYLNERDVALPVPSHEKYYRWADLRPYLISLAYPER